MAPDRVLAAPAGIRTQAPSGLPYRRGLLRAACRRRHLRSSSRAAAGGRETRVSLDRYRGRGLGARPGLGDSDGKRAASAPSEPVGPVRAGCAGDIGFRSDPGPGGRPGSAPRPGSASRLTFRPEAQVRSHRAARSPPALRVWTHSTPAAWPGTGRVASLRPLLPSDRTRSWEVKSRVWPPRAPRGAREPPVLLRRVLPTWRPPGLYYEAQRRCGGGDLPAVRPGAASGPRGTGQRRAGRPPPHPRALGRVAAGHGMGRSRPRPDAGALA